MLKKFLSFLLTVAVVSTLMLDIGALVAVADAPSMTEVLLSLDKEVTASSFQDNQDGTYYEYYGNDGDSNSRWSSSMDMFPQWWQVDLGKVCVLTKVNINWFNSSNNPRSYNYTIDVSVDGLSFTTVIDQTANTRADNTTDVFPIATEARYVRINIVGASIQTWSGFYECSVFGYEGAQASPVLSFADKNSDPVDTLEDAASGSVSAAAVIMNHGTTQTQTTLILALYDENGTLKDINFNRVSVPALNMLENLSVLSPLPEDLTGYYLKAYLWTNFNTMTAFTDSITVGEVGEFSQTGRVDPNHLVVVDGKVVTISGVNPSYANKRVTLEVINPGKNILTATNITKIKETVNYLAQTKADENGNYLFRYTADGTTGDYTVRIGVGTTNPSTASFTYINPGEVDDAVEAINAAETTVDTIEATIDQYRAVLELDTTLYDTLDNKAPALAKLVAGKPYVGKADFVVKFNTEVSVQALAEAESGFEIKELIENATALLKLDADEYYTTFYANMNDAEKLNVCDVLFAIGSFTSLNSFHTAFHSTIDKNELDAINAATSVSELKDILETKKDITRLSTAKSYTDYYIKRADEEQLEICEELFETLPLEKIEDVAQIFGEFVVLYEMARVATFGQVHNIFTELYDIIGLDLDDYNELDNPSAVTKKFLDAAPYTSMEEVKDDFSDYVKAQKDAENANNSYSTNRPGSSNSGSKGSSSQVWAPVTMVEQIRKEQITQTPVKIPEQSDITVLFEDLSDYAWAEDSITDLASRGIVNGKSETEFYPGDKVTREEFMKMLIMAFGLSDATATTTFTDVEKDEWYYESIATAEKSGLTTGLGDGTFGIGLPITRQEIATMIYRTAKSLNIKLTENDKAIAFDDMADAADYAKEAITAMQRANIINGFEGNVFVPKNHANRAEAATIIHRIISITVSK